MSQQYDLFGDSLWLPVDFRSTSSIRFGVGGVFEIPRIYIDQVSRLQHYNVNIELPDSLYADVGKGNNRWTGRTCRPQLRHVLFGGHGATRTNGLTLSHHEIGIAFTGILGMLRLDAAKRLDGVGDGIGFGVARFF